MNISIYAHRICKKENDGCFFIYPWPSLRIAAIERASCLVARSIDCVAVCCCGLLCVAVCTGVLRCVVVCCTVLQYAAVCCSMHVQFKFTH